jgi:hypothetical protein
MADTLKNACPRTDHDLPFAIDLELHVEDRDVIAALVRYDDLQEREDFALEALKIGMLALRRASTALDGEFIQRETTRLLDSMRDKLDQHAQSAHERLTLALKEYFDPESGRFSQRVRRLTADDGELATLLRSLLDGDDSRLAKTLLSHVGENSALMKHLSPDQSQGLLALLRGTVEMQLKQQRDGLTKEFSLDNADGALCRLVKELTAKHGDLSKDIQSKIDVVIKEFSLDEENSALKRLVNNMERAQKTITNEFSLDNEQSALLKLKRELTTILEAHVKTNAEFQEEVKVSLAKLVTKRETEARGTQHGATFEQALFERVNHDAQRRGDVAECTQATVGAIRNCKVGDVVIELGNDCAAAGARIVLEAKEVAGYGFRKAQEEIEQARKNRGADQGVFVFSRKTAPDVPPLSRHGADVFVVWDAEDVQTDVYLQAAIEISRALCIRAAAATKQCVDFAPIDKAVLLIEKHALNLDAVRTSAETIKSSSEKILKRVEIDQKAFVDQLEVLRSSLGAVKQALGEDTAGGGNE